MNEPPTSWDQQEENVSLSTKLANLNVNANEFVPVFGSKTTTIPTSSVPKTPPSTPIIVRHTNQNDDNQIETNNEQQMEQDFPNKQANELFIDDEIESSFLII
jgi:hypothetical protein